MTREWLAGERAKITAANRRTEYDAYFDGEVWREVGARTRCVNTPETARPLVVIDPESREQVERLAKAYGELSSGFAELLDEPWTMPAMRMRQALREFADPKPRICDAVLYIGGERIECERDPGHVTDHRNDSVAQRLRWGA